MRIRTVGILASVFVALLALVVIDQTPAGRGDAGVLRIADARPSEIVRIESSGGGGSVVLERGPSGWVVRRGETVWPVDERRLNAGLRLLTSAVAESADPGSIDAEVECRVWTASGSTTLRIGSETLSGKRAATIDGRPARIDSDVAELLWPSSLGAWASPVAFPGLDAAVNRIEVRPPEGGSFELARVGQRWGVRSPVVTPADSARVGEFIGALSLATVTHIEGPVPTTEPVLSIEASSQTGSWSLALDAEGRGESLASSGDRRFLSTVNVGRESVASLATDVTGLLSRTAIDLPASDISVMRIVSSDGVAGAVFERSGRGWGGDAALADALLDLLTRIEADAVALGEADLGASTLALERFGGLPVPGLALWVDDDAVWVHAGGVGRRYPRTTDAASVVAGMLSGGGG